MRCSYYPPGVCSCCSSMKKLKKEEEMRWYHEDVLRWERRVLRSWGSISLHAPYFLPFIPFSRVSFFLLPRLTWHFTLFTWGSSCFTASFSNPSPRGGRAGLPSVGADQVSAGEWERSLLGQKNPPNRLVRQICTRLTLKILHRYPVTYFGFGDWRFLSHTSEVEASRRDWEGFLQEVPGFYFQEGQSEVHTPRWTKPSTTDWEF